MDRKSIKELMSQEERWRFWNVGKLTVPVHVNLMLTDARSVTRLRRPVLCRTTLWLVAASQLVILHVTQMRTHFHEVQRNSVADSRKLSKHLRWTTLAVISQITAQWWFGITSTLLFTSFTISKIIRLWQCMWLRETLTSLSVSENQFKLQVAFTFRFLCRYYS